MQSAAAMSVEDAISVAREVATRALSGRAEEVDREAVWPEANMRELLKSGLGGLVVPHDAGGHGHGLYAVVRVCETLAEACPSTAISFGMHLVASAVIAAKATAEQRDRYLAPICKGEHLTTLALSEPGTGAHFYIPESKLTATRDGFTITGAKSFVTNGGHADSYVMSVVGEDRGGPVGEFSCVVVSNGAAGLTWGEPWRGWGMRGNSARTATLRDTPIARGDLLGSEGEEIWYVFHVVAPYFLMAMSGTYLGVAAAAVREARRHLLERTYSHTGGPLAENAILQHRLGTLWAQVQRTRAFVHEAARMGDAGHEDTLPALCSAKAEVADAAERVTAEVLTLLGGRGYASNAPAQRLYRDARAAHVMAPTTDMLRTWTGRALLNLPLLGE